MSCKALDILRHIEELYVAEPDFDKIDRMPESNPERVEAYEKAFADYDLVYFLVTLDAFLFFNSSNSLKIVALINAKLSASMFEKTIAEVATHELKLIAPAEQLMQRDIEAKCCRHLLPVYKRAVDYVLGEMLLKEIPASEWRKMSVATRYRQAMDKGLFGRFSEVLVFVCRRDYGKDYQFESEAMLDADRRRNEFNLSDAAEHLAKAWWHN